ncbi:predicted protein [Aspergillus nidulans FGSC A4]|uniref:Uncharacterized protein n=1 Tax=Emericella nidulans (strain FGSC A4 / ATCC 38163 / CBS 112.46 / NRRL 194 / M139) TaxID=227321 RepID=Q5BFZ9_EMENI|nr:hypothetical protein [Aspergillus nidulans FGSC A4]EAA66630.1 predicted protein [Aspergillus nidulans FGSC A4]CBF89297.1 TPA: conserved hypothetical protein [Aspergillus nidulans FGSC A4]|eukprot:XP_658135.1 predicted protein [Aspergillus nidulans FGSC A4]
MTQTTIPHPSDEKPPSFVSVKPSEWDTTEKRVSKVPCTVHSSSQTPNLDHEFKQPYTQDIIRMLTAALHDLADETKCIKCTVEKSSALLTSHLCDIQAAKKTGQWSKEERKALKAEVKSSFKPVKKTVKALWKEGKQQK